MRLKRQLTAQQKAIGRIEAWLDTKARAREANRKAERLQVFWEQLEAKLQAEGHWSSPGEDFFRYVARSVGFDYGRLRLNQDQSGVDELLRAIWEHFPELETTWQIALDGKS